eukprot:5396241-Ditylum_brightwellii.AAC.1
MKENQANILTGGAKKKQEREERAKEVVSEEKAKEVCINETNILTLLVADAMKVPTLPVLEGKAEWAITGTVVINNSNYQYP